jgi:hypothetical protein
MTPDPANEHVAEHSRTENRGSNYDDIVTAGGVSGSVAAISVSSKPQQK